MPGIRRKGVTFVSLWNNAMCCWLAVLMGVSVHVGASVIPEEVVKYYSEREDRWKGFSFVWRVEETFIARIPPSVQAGQRVVNRTRSEWVLASDGATTVVTGTRNQSLNPGVPEQTRREFYGEGWGLSIPDVHSPSAGVYQIWACDGHCVYFRHPHERSGLDVLPEDFVLLIGKNLLKLYSASWQVTSSAGDKLVLRAEVTSGNFAPFSVTAVLTRAYQWEPAEIQVDYTDSISRCIVWSRRYRVVSYRQTGKGWFPELVTCDETPGFATELHRRWSLVRFEPLSEGITLPVADNRATVHDYRLMGTNLTDAQAELRGDAPQSRAVAYRWQGSLPSQHELEQIWRKQVSQTTPPLQPSSRPALWWFVPPLLLILIGAFWYWRVRRAERRA